MRTLPGTSPGAASRAQRDLAPLIAMMGLFFLVVCAVGILRPIKNALALDGLGDTDFYKVYLVSAAVILFVPLYNRLANHVPWRWLIPAVALFFALNLAFFRVVYIEGSTSFGLIFYGWYDLFAAALVTQFFMATQLFFNARSAKRAYPIVIAGGSIGATLGGAVTGFFAERVGTPNLLLVAAALIVLFAVCMPLVWRAGVPVQQPRRPRAEPKLDRGELRHLIRDPHIRLIAATVLITVLVKQLVDYQFNTLSKEVFQDRDAISAFQGKFNAATQWLPLVALAVLQPTLRRYGMAVAVLLLPIAMLLTNAGLLLFWGLWAATAAKGAETSLRYSAERAGREILYVPVPEDIKLRAKAYIDVAVEKGIGKVASAVLIFALVSVMDYRQTVWVGLGLSVLWLAIAISVRREYVRTLARSIQGRFASLRGSFASLVDATTVPVVKQALTQGDALQTSFVLDLIDQAPARDMTPLAPELHALLGHESADIRVRALELLGRMPGAAEQETIRARLSDPSARVREAAVRALCAVRRDESGVIEELLAAEQPIVRTAALACLARGEVGGNGLGAARRAYAARGAAITASDADGRVELALAAGAFRDDRALELLVPFLDDGDARVASTALRSAGLLQNVELLPRIIDGLARGGTREAARDALASFGQGAVPLLAQRLTDPAAPPALRRSIPSALARMPSDATVETLLRSALAPETDQLLDYRTIKALGKLRARHPALGFQPSLVRQLVAREAAAAQRYASARAMLPGADVDPAVALLRQALLEAWGERRETTFRALGLQYPADQVHRCYLALGGAYEATRANAVEWLENTIGAAGVRQLAAVVDEPPASAPTTAGEHLDAVLAKLAGDEDDWIARTARRAAHVLAARTDALPENAAMDTIEKVFLLQKVDLLRDARSAHLAMLASIADEIDVAEGATLLREGEPTDALYVVVRGGVELRGMGGTLLAADGAAFGTWALIDQAPSVVEATATAPSRLLRITRDEFHDLIGDHPELAIGLLQGLARRVRTLVA
jgi:ATP/ADP translocase/HEAT repeat protein